MGATKTLDYTEEQLEFVALARAIAHPARIAILQILAKRTGCICGDLVEELPLSQPTVSQHLKELKNAGLIKGNVEGNSICYCIDPEKLKSVNVTISRLIEVNNKTNCC